MHCVNRVSYSEGEQPLTGITILEQKEYTFDLVFSNTVGASALPHPSTHFL